MSARFGGALLLIGLAACSGRLTEEHACAIASQEPAVAADALECTHFGATDSVGTVCVRGSSSATRVWLARSLWGTWRVTQVESGSPHCSG